MKTESITVMNGEFTFRTTVHEGAVEAAPSFALLDEKGNELPLSPFYPVLGLFLLAQSLTKALAEANRKIARLEQEIDALAEPTTGEDQS